MTDVACENSLSWDLNKARGKPGFVLAWLPTTPIPCPGRKNVKGEDDYVPTKRYCQARRRLPDCRLGGGSSGRPAADRGGTAADTRRTGCAGDSASLRSTGNSPDHTTSRTHYYPGGSCREYA